MVLIVLVTLLLILWLNVDAHSYTGRRAVLYTEAEVMLALNEPWISGKSDCTAQMWRLLSRTFPELRAVKWFKRTTTEAMATWPWDTLLTLSDVVFGDLLFANSEEYASENPPQSPFAKGGSLNSPLGKGGQGGILKRRTSRADFQINHVLMHWDEPETAIHAGKKRGFSRTSLKPYWWPRIVLAIRPPY